MKPPSSLQITVARRAPAPIFLGGYARKEYDRRSNLDRMSTGSRFLALELRKMSYRRRERLENR